MKKLCTIENCDKPVQAKKLCNKHYLAQRPECTIEGCTRGQAAKTYCKGHYENLRLRGNPIPAPRPTIEERFFAFVKKDETKPNGCWIWIGGQTGKLGNRYASFYYDGRCASAHRWIYQQANNVTLTHEPIHHKCGNGLCVNPDHLQIVTPEDNIAEMLERKSYKKRIAYLESEVARLTAISCECAA